MNCVNQAAAARNRMCGTVGGDFHDFLQINGDQTAIVVGDVVGHGVRSSLLMAQIMGFLRSSDAKKRSRPTTIVAQLNRMLIELGERTNTVLPCSLFYGVVDGPTGVFFFVNAGHPRPLLCGQAGCSVVELSSSNMLLGVQDFDVQEDCITFQTGQRLVLYTDGLTDAIGSRGQRFGEERLHKLIGDCRPVNASQCADSIFEHIAGFRGQVPQNDDETVVVLDRL